MRNRTKKNYVGERIGLFVVKEFDSQKSKPGKVYWICRCDCGNVFSIRQDGFKKQRSCGCIRINSLVIGKTYGRLTVLELNHDFKTRNCGANYKCQCSCGNIKNVFFVHLNNGSTKSCGCLARETAQKQMTTHGKSKTRLFRIWQGIKSRCFNMSVKDYYRYGGRGITVCEDWRIDFKNFYSWSIENGYSESLSLDRINNNNNYSPNNCKWSTPIEQQNNTRLNKACIINNKYFTSLAEVSRVYNIKLKTIYRLYRSGNLEKYINEHIK